MALTIAELQQVCWQTAEDKGFHDDRPWQCEHVGHDPADNAALQHWQGNKLMLIVSEAAEAQDELRNGRPATETYYKVPAGHDENVAGPLKPEGVPSELADIVIRVLDFCGTEGIDLEAIIEEKLAYNASRPYKHGKQF